MAGKFGFPREGLLRLSQIIGDPDASPPVPAIVPVGRSSWWAGVRTGQFPPAVKLGPRTTAWRSEHINALVATGDWRSAHGASSAP
jgi:prophage regulatory protein